MGVGMLDCQRQHRNVSGHRLLSVCIIAARRASPVSLHCWLVLLWIVAAACCHDAPHPPPVSVMVVVNVCGVPASVCGVIFTLFTVVVFV